MTSFLRRPGASLVEVIVAVGIFSIIAVALSRLSYTAFGSGPAAREYTEASAIASQGLEATRAIASRDWTNMTDGAHGIVESGGMYVFSGTSDTQGKYRRVVTVSTATRDVGGNLVGLRDTDRRFAFIPHALAMGAGPDTSTKKVVSVVTWLPVSTTRTPSVTLTTYLTNWKPFGPSSSSSSSSAGASSSAIGFSSSAIGFSSSAPGASSSSVSTLSSSSAALSSSSMAALSSSIPSSSSSSSPPFVSSSSSSSSSSSAAASGGPVMGAF